MQEILRNYQKVNEEFVKKMAIANIVGANDIFNNAIITLTGIGLCLYVYVRRKKFFPK